MLAIARQHGLALWTISRGRNFAYGGAEAQVPGSAICDLGRMNRILSADESTGVASVGPGVSFQALDAHLRATGSSRDRFYDGPGLMPEGALRAATDEFDIGSWNAQLGVPSNDAIGMIAWRGGTPAHSDIGLVSQPTATSVDRLRALVREQVEAAGLDFTAGFMHWPRHIVAMTLVSFDRDDAAQTAVIGELISSTVVAAAAECFGSYRAHVEHMDVAAAQYSFNDHVIRSTTTPFVQRPRRAPAGRAPRRRTRSGWHPLPGKAGHLAGLRTERMSRPA